MTEKQREIEAMSKERQPKVKSLCGIDAKSKSARHTLCPRGINSAHLRDPLYQSNNIEVKLGKRLKGL